MSRSRGGGRDEGVVRGGEEEWGGGREEEEMDNAALLEVAATSVFATVVGTLATHTGAAVRGRSVVVCSMSAYI